jgi:hypothetical protein
MYSGQLSAISYQEKINHFNRKERKEREGVKS